MDRRHFCHLTMAAGATTAFPFLSAGAPTLAQEARSGVRAVSLDGAEIEIGRSAVRDFGAAMRGPVLLAGDPAYDQARKIWNGMHDKHPALIARCADSADVSDAVNFAREHRLLLAVRGGGHSWPGKSVCQRGLMLDLSAMNGVRVDADARRAHAQGGALLNTLDTSTLKHGLVTTAGVVSHTGVGGFTLGGGFGRLNRKYGLTIDNLVSAEIVTADGAVRRVSADQEPDLFWAIRGGGGNFGVVTEFDYRLHPFDRNVLSGNIVWPVEQAGTVLDFYADWAGGLSDELYVGPALLTMSDGQGVLVMEVVYNGDPAAGEKELEPLRRTGKPAEDGVKVQDYMVMQTQEDAAFAHGIRSYAKSGMAKEVTRDLIAALIDSYRPDPRLAFFTHTAGGAVSRVGELDTAFPHRKAETMLIVAGAWTDPADDAEAIALAREWFAEIEPYTGGYYDNIEFDGQGAAGNYGPAYERLSRIKGRYDAMNLFRLNSNVRPA
ncbi:FAD-binding oxidoreductase [Lentisalinibacter salinarum]|uniref:FAD-binding oxidoreductase n=1 Tax=Lentisalinibacter salinarum TaxID=2992239 RepID=UPI00386F605F